MSAKKNTYTINSNETDLYWIKKFWKNILFYSKNFKNSDSINLTENIQKEIEVFTDILITLGPIRSNTLRFYARKDFSKDPLLLMKTYNSLLELEKKDPNYFDEFNPISYSYNKSSFRTQFLSELLHETRLMNPQLEFDRTDEFKILQKNINILDDAFEKRLKQNYTHILISIGDFLKKFNLLEEFSNTYTNMMGNYGLQELSYPAHTDLPNCRSIDTFFTKNYLNNLTIPKLAALSGFWLNKTAKAIISLNTMLFIINEYNLWPAIKSNKKFCPLEDDKIISILMKTNFLSKLENSLFDSTEKIRMQNPNMNHQEVSNLFVSTLNQRISQEEVKYKNKFDVLLPETENNLEKDITKMHKIANVRYLLYRLKDMCIFNLLIGSIDNHYSKNWGVIPETIAADGFVNINFDIEGLNLPLRLHMYKSELIDFLNTYTSDSIIPLYKGANDLTIDGRYISSSILAPMQVKQTNCINQKLKNTTKLSQDIINFLRHLKFLKDHSKMPPSLKNTNSNEPNAINLETGEKLTIPIKEMFK